MMRALALLAASAVASLAQIPGAAPLIWEGEFAPMILDGMHRFIDRKIEASAAARANRWRRDESSPQAYDRSVAANRERLRRILGVVDSRVLPRMERYTTGEPEFIAETALFRAYQVRWPVLRGVSGEGLLLEPKRAPAGYVVALGDADHTPEMLAGLAEGLPPEAQFARRLAESGFVVVVPVLVDRAAEISGNAGVKFTNQPHREWLVRQAYVMGRHIIGYEVQKIFAVVDWFRERAGVRARVGIAGYGEGGLLAFYAAALDTRIDGALISGYFDSRQKLWEEPLYRLVWGLLDEFGDAEIASLIAPRVLVVEHSQAPRVDGPRKARTGEVDAAAPGSIASPSSASVEAEFARLDKLVSPAFHARALVRGAGGGTIGPGSAEAVHEFVRLLGVETNAAISRALPVDLRGSLDPVARLHRQIREIEDDVQALLAGADQRRDAFFTYAVMPELKKHPKPGALRAETLPASEFAAGSRRFRTYFHEEILGRIGDPLLPPNPRSRKTYDRPAWTGYEVLLDALPDVVAAGILLVPKDLKPGERRPVVVAQHGLEGTPKDVVEGDVGAYHDFAARLADRGFVVFAPQNPYRGGDRFRSLNKKANTVRLSMFSFIVAQHDQILSWLASLPFVDESRIGFYGLSYGGTTAMRVPSVLEGYALSICSANFNEDIYKTVSTAYDFAYPFYRTWEVGFFNLGDTFGHAELAYLILPRPFMVERGMHDTVGTDAWVSHEFGKVRWLYSQLGIGDRAEIEYFNGTHTINGEGTFAFLHRHLKWPEPATQNR